MKRQLIVLALVPRTNAKLRQVMTKLSNSGVSTASYWAIYPKPIKQKSIVLVSVLMVRCRLRQDVRELSNFGAKRDAASRHATEWHRHLNFIKTVELPPKIIEANKKDGDTPKPNSFHGVSFSPDGKLIAAGNENQNVWIWNRDGKLPRSELDPQALWG